VCAMLLSVTLLKLSDLVNLLLVRDEWVDKSQVPVAYRTISWTFVHWGSG
jgi:hypothetical protein